MKSRTRLFNFRYLISFVIIGTVSAQLYVPADPFDLLFTEQKIMMGGEDYGSLMIRPIVLPQRKNNNWSLKFRSDVFYNDGSPNLENTSDKWVGKGFSFFTSTNISFNSKYLFTSFEPFVFTSQNDDYEEPLRIEKFMHLNDNLAHSEQPYKRYGFRETQLYLKYNEYGIGWSNANMWWGPGLHSSLMMSNNTTGFGHLMIGTVNEKRIGDWGINGRYIFSKFGEKSVSQPYFSGFIVNASYYSKPIVTIGFSRSFLSGGKNSKYDIGAYEAALLPFQFVTVENVDDDALNPIDQTYTGYLNLRFPDSGLVMYLEYGRNEGPQNFKEFLIAPNHSNAYLFGLRKYGLFNNINLMMGFEYTNIAHSSFWNQIDTEDWYSNFTFDYNTYDGRNFAAHSGPDSDDFLFWLGYSNYGFTMTTTFNYERHSLTHTYIKEFYPAGTLVYDNYLWGEYYNAEDKELYTRIVEFPETKIEFGLTVKKIIKNIGITLHYELQNVINYEFMGTSSNIDKKNNIIFVAIEKCFSY